ncbi:hypothetical protein BDK51DRAFT_20241 [Blyttiomyces helicus]|uniref:Eukaryotic translation initiation factor 3 subunit A n=1 Tax=Blyttiomyces helicus TaxID=388810 RepID=A0A4P9WI29_9FUNG|nr:hypothetical protein BDK51DRAFT_20241 [Blyttiomyces helicus]|eukprot:RKO91635.1 hypothetical protein BDK51DRAFT_20241 [Blyttiomyces helicus]
MSRFYHRPENALKRAEELIAVSQNGSALTLLHEIIMSKRSRSTPLTALEPIMLKFVELCVILRKGKTAKEGLHQYKNISQNVTVSTIELVIKKFIELSENKVAEAQAKADKITLDAVDDLEASETPESIILSTVSGEVDKDRTDREVVTPWLKFLWEAYRTALDILRNNARLELLYQSVANQAFHFCLKYARKTEFRRLCELLRQHLATAAKYAHQTHAINLNDPDTLQRHLDTRFVQLNAAAELQLWQEAFRSIEDIHNLLAMSKKPPKPFMMANYYEKLARIFMVSENYLFHAAAWSKYYATVRQNKSLSEEEHQRMASIVLMSALAIPIIAPSKTRGGYADNDENKPKTTRLANLLRAARVPTREQLLKEALGKAVFSRVRPELKSLYQILEAQFHPLSICKKIVPILSSLTEQKDMSPYIKPLHQVILTRLLQQLSQVYTTINIESVVKLASFPEPYNYDAHTIEKFVMNGCKRGELSIRVNHQSQTLTFEVDYFAASKGSISEGPQLQSMPSEQMRLELTRLAKRLHTAVVLIDPSQLPAHKAAKKAAFIAARENIEEERQQAAHRRMLIEKKKELRENEILIREKEEQRAKAIKAQEEAEAEKARIEAESKRRETDRLIKARQDIEKAEVAKLAAQLAGELKDKNVKMTQEELDKLDTAKLLALQVQQIEKEKRDLQNKLRLLGKKFDHLERAYRKEEIPLLETDYEEQKKTDRAQHAALRRAQLDAAKIQHEEDMQIKARLSRMHEDYTVFKGQLDSQRNEFFSAAQARAARQIAAAKEQRIEEIRQQKIEEKRRRLEDEMRRAAREQQEREEAAARELREAELAIERERKKAEDAERQKKLDEQAERQRERERLAEEKIARDRAALREQAAPRPAVPATEGGWRSRTAGAAAAGTPAPASDSKPDAWRPRPREGSADTPPAAAPSKYTPPARRTDGPPTGDRYSAPRRTEDRPSYSGARRADDRPAEDRWRRAEPASAPAPAPASAPAPAPAPQAQAPGSPAPSGRPQIGAGKWTSKRAQEAAQKPNEDDGFQTVRRK